jgi:hypothetical protein
MAGQPGTSLRLDDHGLLYGWTIRDSSNDGRSGTFLWLDKEGLPCLEDKVLIPSSGRQFYFDDSPGFYAYR